MTEKIFGNDKRGLVFVISAPAGTGKSTLVNMLLEEYPEDIAESCSCTTRSPRPGEIQHLHYHFLSRQEFETKIKAGEFLEYAEVFGNYYGTLRSEVEHLQNQKKHVILVIDTQGAMQLKGKIPAVFIFVQPPSKEELKRRLKQRGTEQETVMAQRLSKAEEECSLAKEYDYQIVNDSLEKAYQELKSILIAEGHKNRKLK